MPPTLHDGICTNNSYIHTYGGAITAPLLAAIHNWDLPLESDSRTVVQLGDGFNHRCLKRRPLGAESLARARPGEPAPLNPTTPEAPATRQPRKRRQPGSPGSAGNPTPPGSAGKSGTPEAPAPRQPRKRRQPGNPGSAGNPAARHLGNPALRHSGTSGMLGGGRRGPWPRRLAPLPGAAVPAAPRLALRGTGSPSSGDAVPALLFLFCFVLQISSLDF